MQEGPDPLRPIRAALARARTAREAGTSEVVSEFGQAVAVLTGEARVAERMEALWAGVLRELEGGW